MVGASTLCHFSAGALSKLSSFSRLSFPSGSLKRLKHSSLRYIAMKGIWEPINKDKFSWHNKATQETNRVILTSNFWTCKRFKKLVMSSLSIDISCPPSFLRKSNANTLVSWLYIQLVSSSKSISSVRRLTPSSDIYQNKGMTIKGPISKHVNWSK